MEFSLNNPIAQGRTAEVYTWDAQHILKLYREWCPPDWVEYEAAIARTVVAAGIPTPATGEIVEVRNRRGIIYERVTGISMLADLKARPWTFIRHARGLAELQSRIHQLSITGLGSYRDSLAYAIERAAALPDTLRAETLELLATLPDGNAVCHGDFHPDNIIITESGPVVIDWMTAKTGNPWADVARTSMILTIGIAAAPIGPILSTLSRLYHSVYLRRYRALAPDASSRREDWIPMIAAARLNEHIVREREALLRTVEQATEGELAAQKGVSPPSPPGNQV